MPIAVTSFTLVDTRTGFDLLTITDGMTIDMASLGTRRITVRANTNVTPVGSVVFHLDNLLWFNADNGAPYALFNTANAATSRGAIRSANTV
jgi:hypothetical protein